ncbi:hypothetical protein CHLNCDRAFT_140792 [Chlorella variabilis]|uniref:Protein kinase domain-containing protein n=1 Tax=Chlorella variabilis TaxID=554065 RepID=E1Z681_CHLVA|nr:hypothetical protein CHLNCDRAFT_140792 [Chlorella variabilis]EFN58884.1 hypothetical protein CHLNCDRAFT_140792 [Chlorella variabilis]|eukprot:XP_005850986.1 hypothetical protein CHLNCDRAFT_140792 [Chlorella variabilis]
MQQQGEEDVAGSSLGESNPLVGSAGRPGKRPRAADAAATQEQQQPAGAGPAMHLRSAQKRLLAAEAAARTDSAVGSSQQLDRTDSCGGPRGGSADAPTTAAGPPAAGPPLAPRHHAQQSRQHAQGEQSARHTAPAAEAAAAQPPAKRRRVMRTGVPAPLPAYELRRGFERPSPPEDDENGHYQFEIGENLAPRFKIMRKFGEGTFGQARGRTNGSGGAPTALALVLECWDRKRKDYVAVKIIRNIQKYRDAAMVELEALNTLAANDPSQDLHCVQLLEWFDYRGHVCMVFERLGPSLYDILRKNGYKPFPLAMAQAFARQLLQSVSFMHDLQLVHTDLKPGKPRPQPTKRRLPAAQRRAWQNILVLSQELTKDAPGNSKVGKKLPVSADIRVIDFGSAIFNSDYHSSIVSTRHYRAPEVILGLGWSFPCDLWSMGCILIELLTGDALFQTHENLEHLAMMEAVLGPIPPSMAAAAADNVRGLFRRRAHAAGGAVNKLNWPEGAESKKSVKAVKKLKKLRDYLRQHSEDAVRSHLDTIVDLLQGMLKFRAGDRITAAEALQHPFFQLQL